MPKIKKVSSAEIEALKNDQIYPVETLSGAFGFASNQPVNRWFNAGIISEIECVLHGGAASKGRRGRGVKLRLQIRGREIKRLVLRDGPRPKSLTAA